ncbi:MAG: hydroxyacid dehydrogenase [Candidatus Micrarchaeota archaeon]|nr:hydroxyacid dehydrogenase [Candidatus Micrarchaeota archaeon]MDE1847878.1 hydroxyacid dehydrogenase [Candidatus Micrarchaeota archaeon]MDE1864205.1 hydroxyacid dehydrogenase [Candidatus Micrarchaeota archaeon]
MTRILVTEPEYFDEDARKELRKSGELVLRRLGRKPLEKIIPTIDVLVVRIETKVDRRLLGMAKRLKIIGSATTGLDHIDLEFAKGMGIKVISLHGIHTIPTAEHTMALMISLCRNIPWAHMSLSKGAWQRHRFIGRELNGKTLGIVGLGRIGKQVAKYAVQLGMNVTYYDPNVFRQPLARKITSLPKLLSGADILSIHASLTKETNGLIGRKEISQMKESSLLINTARGKIVDYTALLDALAKHAISGAAIDVFPNEPLENPADPIIAYARRHQNLLVTPHLGGSTREAIHRAGLEVSTKIGIALKANRREGKL